MIARALVAAGVVALALFLGACVAGLDAPTPLPSGPAPLRVARTYGDVTVHAVRTGWVSVKEAHRAYDGPRALRQLAILGDGAWTEWMPVTVYVIDHPEGVFLVDAGLSDTTSAIALDPACDGVSRWVYGNLLRFSFDPASRVDRHLDALGIDPARVRAVVTTHLHADHVDALGHLPASTAVIVGEADWAGHDGALRCRWPDVTPRLVPSSGAPHRGLSHAEALTADGRLHVVALPGHSPGHLGVLLEVEGGPLLFAGDAAFSSEQIDGRRLAGIDEDAGAARETLARLHQLRAEGALILPSHDADALRSWALAEGSVRSP